MASLASVPIATRKVWLDLAMASKQALSAKPKLEIIAADAWRTTGLLLAAAANDDSDDYAVGLYMAGLGE